MTSMFYITAALILATIDPCISDGEQKPKPTPYQDWDYLVYSQRWPITGCLDWKQRNPSNTCNLPEDNTLWVIHGIWPTKKGTNGPWFCNSAIHFDPDQLQPILQDLEEHWPNIENNTKPTSFWKHEWSKHGTCAAVLPQLDSVVNFFQQGLTWNLEYKLSDILGKNKIVPDAEGYNISSIYNTVVGALGKNPIIQCVVNGKTKQSMISEIQICFDKNLELIHCNVTGDMPRDDILGNCNRKNSIMYYAEVPNSTHSEEDLFEYDADNDADDEVEELSLAEECYENFVYEKTLHKIYSIIKFLMWFTL